VNLLLRYFKTTSGEILIDDQNINYVTQDSLRENIAVIPQDTMLFHRSLLENIRYGRLSATEEEVIEASKAAHIHEFIIRLPDQYQTYVGERGVKLSGGQRQRISIARAILNKPVLLLADEPTGHLDPEVSLEIMSLFQQLNQQGTTILMASHDYNTMRKVSGQFLQCEGGKISPIDSI
jgi:ATP-binding cassette subfamily B protein